MPEGVMIPQTQCELRKRLLGMMFIGATTDEQHRQRFTRLVSALGLAAPSTSVLKSTGSFSTVVAKAVVSTRSGGQHFGSLPHLPCRILQHRITEGQSKTRALLAVVAEIEKECGFGPTLPGSK